MRRAHFKVVAAPGERFAPGVTEASVEILTDDEGRNAVLTVRPKHSRQTYSLTLESVARRVIQADVAATVGVNLAPSRRPR
jgi:hypothetical protein